MPFVVYAYPFSSPMRLRFLTYHLARKKTTAIATSDIMTSFIYSPYCSILSLSWLSGTMECRYQPRVARMQFQHPAPIVV